MVSRKKKASRVAEPSGARMVEDAETPPRVEYRLTEFDRECSSLIGEVRRLQATLDRDTRA